MLEQEQALRFGNDSDEHAYCHQTNIREYLQSKFFLFNKITIKKEKF